MRVRYVALFGVVAATIACPNADPTTLPDAVRTAANAIDSAQLRADVTYLASDALLGRDTPSPGQDSAAAYVVRRLTALGLSPAGDSGTWLQHYGVRNAVLDSIATYVEVGGKRYTFGTDFLVSSFADSGTTTARLTYVGHGIRAPKKNIDPYAGVTTRGRTVIAHGPAVFPRGETFQTLGAPLTDWMPAQLTAVEQGAAALMLINPPRTLALWTRSDTRLRGLQSRRLWPAVPSAWARSTFPVLWVTPAMGAALIASAPASALGAGGAEGTLARAAQGDFVPSFELPAASTATVHLALRQATMQRPYNIVARIEGSDPKLKAEAVVLAAHLDGAVGSARGPGDAIFNAADDNASGSAALLAIAGAMMRAPRPRRTVIFVWDTGEEIGLWGSQYFAANPPVPLANVVTYFNVDMIGRTKQLGTNVEGEEELAGPDEIFVAGPRALSTGLDSLLERTNRAFLNIRVNHTYDRADHEFFYPRTDAAPLLERGVITVNYMNGEHGDYHGVGDEAAKLDIAKMTRVTQTIFASAWVVASVRERPVMDKGIPATVKRYPLPSAQPAQILGPDTVSFTSGALTLRGIIYRPSGAGPFPTILFNHGSGRDYTREVAAVGPAYAAQGFVFFAPSRRGQWLSTSTGQYVLDSLNAIGRSQGLDARNTLLVTLMKGPQLDDVRSALVFIKTKPYVQRDRVVVSGNSYGGIVTMYAAAYLDGLWAAVNFAGAAQSWESSPPLQAALTDVAKLARIPVFFGQAENDYDLTPSRSLSATMSKAGKPNVMKIFPVFGTTTAEGHSFGYFGGATWGPEVVAFVKNPPR